MTASNNLYDHFIAGARRHPGATALDLGAERYTYAALEDRAETIASSLRQGVTGPVRAVALCSSRSVTAYAGYLATLRAGAAVVPLSLTSPSARTSTICRAVGVDAVLTDDAGAPMAEAVRTEVGVPVLRINGTDARWSRGPSRARPETSLPPSTAYVLFTSGSTGRPKGVPIGHRQLDEYIPYCVDRYEVEPGARLTQNFELTFDPSVFDMFVAWAGGGTVVVPRDGDLLKPAAFVNDREVTHWFSVPSVISLAARLRGLTAGSMPHLRWSLFAGEQLTIDQARAWQTAAPRSTVENLYGPTELTITCTNYRLPSNARAWPTTPNGTVPIGVPYPHLEVLLADGEHATTTTVGELCVRGRQRFGGYLDPSEDDGRFLRTRGDRAMPVEGPADPTDWYRTGDRVRWHNGQLVHLGRIDHQLKIGGHRIEPGEIEGVLRRHPGIADAVVVVTAGSANRTELVAVYTGEAIADDELRRFLQHSLPGYMVPGSFCHVDALPINDNGKVDRPLIAGSFAIRPAR